MGCFVYCHINKKNGKMYFGITCRKPEYRWKHGEGYSKNSYFNAAIKKYGWDNFHHKVIASGITRNEACEMEKQLIKKYNTTDENYGYNIGTGGEHGAEGSKRTKEQNLAKSKQMKIRMRCPETIEKIKKNRVGMKFSEKHIENLRKSHIGHSPSNKGVSMSETQKLILKDRKRNKMIKIKCLNTGEVFESIRAAAISMKLMPGNISQVCSGKRKQTGGYQFSYV